MKVKRQCLIAVLLFTAMGCKADDKELPASQMADANATVASDSATAASSSAATNSESTPAVDDEVTEAGSANPSDEAQGTSAPAMNGTANENSESKPANVNAESNVAQSSDNSGESGPAYHTGGMFSLYKENRAQGLPNLITPDFVLLAYSQLRSQRIAAIEAETLSKDLDQLLAALDQSFAAEAKTEAARFNQRLVRILRALWSSDPSQLDEEAAKEYALIMAAGGIDKSPLWQISVDYSQFSPRGRYSSSDELQRYFRTVRYATSALYCFKPSGATGVDEALAALNASRAKDMATRLQQPVAAELYQKIDGALSWQFGPADDLTLTDLQAVFSSEGDEPKTYKALLDYAEQNDRIPRIIGGVVDANRLEPGQTANEVLVGWRLLPSRFSADTGALQELVYQGDDALVLKCDKCEQAPLNASVILGKQVKGYPSYLEVLALLGSDEAAGKLDDSSLREYTNYEQRADDARTLLEQAQGLSERQFSVMKAVLADAGNADASNAAAGFWVWQKYLNLLYQKQSYTVQGKNLVLSEPAVRSGAWISGDPASYNAIAELADSHQKFDRSDKWAEFSEIARKCSDVATSIENDEQLSAESESFLNDLDLSLAALGAGGDGPVVVDIHTNAADNKVVEVATGYPLIRQHERARGAVFSVYEFNVDLDKRLTVESWREVLPKLVAE